MINFIYIFILPLKNLWEKEKRVAKSKKEKWKFMCFGNLDYSITLEDKDM